MQQSFFFQFFLFSFLLSYSIFSYGQSKIDSVLICDAKFKDSQYDNAHAGSACLVKVDKKTYLVTAKHVLYFAKTQSMNSVSFGDSLLSWNCYPKDRPSKTVKAGRLINEDRNEKLEGMFEGDWLIFEIQGKLPEELAVYNIRKEALEPGEVIQFLGYPYKKEDNSPIRIKGKFSTYTKHNNFKAEVPAAHYNGCSGGPVLDADGKLIGLVSMGWFNEETNEMTFEPTGLWYFLNVLSEDKP